MTHLPRATALSLAALVAVLAAAGCEKTNDLPRLQEEAQATSKELGERFDELAHRGEAIGKRARALPPANLDAADAQRAYRHALGAINEARGQLGQLAGEIDSGVKANDRSKLWMLTAKTREHLDRQLIVIAGELDAVDSWVWYAEQRAAVAPVR